MKAKSKLPSPNQSKGSVEVTGLTVSRFSFRYPLLGHALTPQDLSQPKSIRGSPV